MRCRGIERIATAAAGCLLLLGVPSSAQYREYYLRGKIVDAQQQPIAGVEIQLRQTALSLTFRMKTGKDGRYKFAGLPRGLYEARFAKQGYSPAKVEWKFETPQDRMQVVDIPDIVLTSEEQVRKVQELKANQAETKAAAEKIRERNFDAAIAQLEPLVRKDPKNVNALYFLGLGYAGKKMYAEAVTALTQVAELQPAFPGAHFELGVCYRELRDLPRALAAFEKNLELDPKNADSAYNAGLILFQSNRIAEALPRFEQGLAQKPLDPDFLEMAGRCYVHEGQFAQALEFLEKARAAATDAGKAAFLGDLVAKVKAQMK